MIILTIAICVFSLVFICPLLCIGYYYIFIQPKFPLASNEKKKEKEEDTMLLKNGFSENKLNECGKFDIIVIGSGIGGLSSAVMLTRCGYKVLVLEQHDVAGGCTHTFEEQGYEFDIGIHYLGGNIGDKHSPIGFIFNLLSLGYLKWDKMDFCFDTAKISPNLKVQPSSSLSSSVSPSIESMDFVGNVEVSKAVLKRSFPEESSNIDTYFRLIEWTQFIFPILLTLKTIPIAFLQSLCDFFLKPLISPFLSLSTKEALDSCIGNAELKGMLCWMYGDYGLAPSDSAFLMNALITSHYLKGGAYYPRGGSTTIARSLIRSVVKGGGTVFVRAPVGRIILNASGTAAIGVTVRGKDIFAGKIISAAGFLNTYTRLIPEGVQCDYAVRVRRDLGYDLPTSGKLSPSCSMISVFVGLKKGIKELGLPSRNTWLFPSWDHDANMANYRESVCKATTVQEKAEYYFPLVFLSSSAAKDTTWESRFPGRSVIEILTIADYDTFYSLASEKGKTKPKHRGAEYEQFKKHVETRLLEILKEQYPHLADDIDFVDSGTPLSNNFYLGAVRGEVYGLSHTSSRFLSDFLQPRQNGIKNLYLSGQDVACDGLCGGLAGGLMASIAVDPLRVLADLIGCFLYSRLFQ